MAFLQDGSPQCLWSREECQGFLDGAREAGYEPTILYRLESPCGNSRLLDADSIRDWQTRATRQYAQSRVDIEAGLGGSLAGSAGGTYDTPGALTRGGPCNSRGQAYEVARDHCGARYAVSVNSTPQALNDQIAAFLAVLDVVPDGNETALADALTSTEYDDIPVENQPIADFIHEIRGCLPDFQTLVTFG